MIPRSCSNVEPLSWQQALSDSISDVRLIAELLPQCTEFLEEIKLENSAFPLRLPRCYLNKLAQLNQPAALLRQFLPREAELIQTPGYSIDPLAEQKTNHLPGLLHKYHSRVLLSVTSACAVHCRYCFRRHFPYTDNNPGKKGWQRCLDYIKQNQQIDEVILSGGDPLSLSNEYLAFFLQAFATMPHIQTIRLHTRFPAIIPQRIDEKLLQLFQACHQQVVVVMHINHSLEIDDTVQEKMQQLRQQGVTLLNQSVLLHQVNDQEKTLIDLSKTLWQSHILPYYLHLPDAVQGTAHFNVSKEKAQQLHLAMQAALPGYLVPRLVQEQAGQASKTWIAN